MPRDADRKEKPGAVAANCACLRLARRGAENPLGALPQHVNARREVDILAHPDVGAGTERYGKARGDIPALIWTPGGRLTDAQGGFGKEATPVGRVKQCYGRQVRGPGRWIGIEYDAIPLDAN